MTDTNTLYHPIIKLHNRHPYHFEVRSSFGYNVLSNSAMCGDKFHFYLSQKDGKLNEIYFSGIGCAVSKASGSVLAEALEGKTIGEAKELIAVFLTVLEGSPTISVPENFQAFAVVQQFPERYDCAALHWHEMQKFLETFPS